MVRKCLVSFRFSCSTLRFFTSSLLLFFSFDFLLIFFIFLNMLLFPAISVATPPKRAMVIGLGKIRHCYSASDNNQ